MTISAATTLVAYYEPDVVTVHFKGQDGTELTTIKSSFGETVTADQFAAAAAMQAGYTATNWKIEGASSNWTAGTDKLDGETTFVATWTPRVYTVAYNGNTSDGGTAPTSQYFQYTKGVVNDANATNALNDDGKTSAEWAADSDATHTAANFVQATSLKAAKNGYTKNDTTVPSSYVFTGWNTKANGTGTAIAAEDELSGAKLASLEADYDNFAGTITLYAQWQEVWKVTFGRNGYGTAPKAQDIPAAYELNADGTRKQEAGKDIPVPALVTDPGKLTTDAGFEFVGWYDGDKKWDFAADKVSSNKKLTAKWEKAKHEVKFELEGVTIDAASVETGDTVTLPTKDATGAELAKAKTGYELVDGSTWFTDEARTKPFVATTKVTEPFTLYGKWTPIQYAIAYNSGNATGVSGSMPTADKFTYDATNNQLSENQFETTGSEFIGWNTDATKASQGEVEYTDKQVITTNLTADKSKTITFYAVWQPSYKIVYQANLAVGTSADSDNGFKSGNTRVSTDQTQLVKVGDSATLKSDAELDLAQKWYDFVNWENATDSTDKTAYKGGDSFKTTAESGVTALTLKAKWIGHKYTITYDLNEGTATTAPAAQYMRYIEGVTNADGVLIDADGKTEAEVKAADSTATFTRQSSLKLAEGDGITRDGYMFGGWNTKADGTGTSYTAGQEIQAANMKEDLKLYAVWQPTTFTVSYTQNDPTAGVVAADKTAVTPAPDQTAKTITYGKGLTLDVPGASNTIKHYTFKGWNTRQTPTVENPGVAFAAGDKITDVKAAEAAADTKAVEGNAYVANTVKLYGQWEGDAVTVTFKNYDGTELIKDPVKYGETATYMRGVTPRVNPERIDDTGALKYTFAGWATKADATTSDWTEGTTLVTGDIDVFAIFTSAPAKYSVYFNNNGVKASLPTAATYANKDYGTKWGATTLPVPADAKANDSGYEFDGWYEATFDDDGELVSIADEKYAFSGELKGDVTLYAKWKTADASKTIPVPEAIEGLTFNGDYQKGVAEGTGYTFAEIGGKAPEGMTVNYAVDAGTHYAKAELEDGYLWDDGSASDKTIEFEIAKKETSLPVAEDLVFNDTLQTAFKVIPEGVSYASGDYFIQRYVKADGYTTIFGIDDNYKWDDGSTAILREVSWTIDPASVAVPKAVSGLKYTGKTLTGVKAGAKYTVKGNTGKAVKSYKATATLKDAVNYEWADGTTAAKSISWKIAKGANTISAKNATKTLKAKKGKLAKKATFAVSAKAKTAVKYAKSGKWKAGITLKGNKITVKKGMKKGTYTVKVKLTAAANKNFVAAKAKTVSVKIVVK